MVHEGEDKRRDQKRAQRTDLPLLVNPPENPPEGQNPPEGPQNPSEQQNPPEPPVTFPFQLESYMADCFVDVDVMLAHNACVARGTFTDAQGKEVLVHVPTMTFFALNKIHDNAAFLWDCLSLSRYFELPPWGPDLRRAWECLSTLDKNNKS